jgi:hypothetical protein
MISASTYTITSLPFVAARGILNTVDKVIDPLCCVEFLATPPRIVQIAINSLGLLGVGAGAVATSLIGEAPLPRGLRERVSLWNNDAWMLSSELVKKIGRLSIAAIPIAGNRTLRSLDVAVDAADRLTRENEDLRDTIIVKNEEVMHDRWMIDGLREQLQALQSGHNQVQLLIAARKALEEHSVDRERTQAKLADEKRVHEQQAVQLKARTDELQEQLNQLSQTIFSLTSQIKEKEKTASEIDKMLLSTQRHLASSSEAVDSARSLERKISDLQEQIMKLTLQQASLESASEQTAQQIEALIAPVQ